MLRCTIALMMLIGCASAEPAVPDAGPSTCGEIVTRWTAIVDSPPARSCGADADCVFVGGPRLGCACGPSMAHCGLPTSRNAWFSEEARALETRFEAECTDFGGICDCGHSVVTCVGGACVAGPLSSCFGPPDAG